MPEISTLADACSAIVDCAHKTAPTDLSGGYFAVGTPAMRGNVINYAEARPISQATFDEWTTRLRPRIGDLLLAREAPVGPVVRIPKGKNVAPGQRTVLLRPDPGVVDSDFLYFYLTSPAAQAALAVKASGSTVPHLNVADVRQLPMPDVPTLPKQRAIAEALGALDDKIASNVATVGLLDALAHAQVQHASSGCSPVALSSITTMTTRGITPRYTTGEGWTVLNQKCVRDHEVSLESARLMEAKPSAADRLLRADDLLVNSTGQGTLGRTARWTTETKTVTVDSHITIVRFDEQQVDPAFAGIAALSLDSQIELLAEGSTGQTELRRDLLGALTLRLPDLATQTSVGDQIRQQDAIVNALRCESARLRATRDELLPLLMSGRLSVRDAERAAENVT